MREIGTLFATEGEVDKYFPFERNLSPEAKERIFMLEFKACSNLPPEFYEEVRVAEEARQRRIAEQQKTSTRVTQSVVEHIQSAPEREFTALRRANARDLLLTHAQERDFVIERMTKL